MGLIRLRWLAFWHVCVLGCHVQVGNDRASVWCCIHRRWL